MIRRAVSRLRSGRYRLLAWTFILLGTAGLLASGYVYVRRSAPPGPDPAAHGVNVDPAPSSIRPGPQEISAYEAAPRSPRYIRIPSIKVDTSRVMKLGLAGSGRIATPRNIFDAGWYDGSSLPGQSGATFMYGHVASWKAKGIFYDLKKLKPGSSVIVTTGGGTSYTYQVVSSKIYPAREVNMRAVLAPIDTKKSGLNLMTCTGPLIKGTSEYSQRLVVFTKLVDVRT